MNKLCSLLLFVLIIGSNVLVSCTVPGLKPESENLPSLESARSTMINFLDALNQKKYTDAAMIFGGDLDILRSYNPDIDPDDAGLLFERACQFNGFQCMQLKMVVSEDQIDDHTFVFTIELKTSQGDLFVLGPCCGATEEEMPPVSQFQMTVAYSNNAYRVMDLPPYVP